MPLFLQLSEGRELRLNVDLDAWTNAFEQALRNSEVIEVRNPEGQVLAINPRQVLYWKTDLDPSSPGPPAQTVPS